MHNMMYSKPADNASPHKFKPHKAYPCRDFGANIDGRLRPVPDRLFNQRRGDELAASGKFHVLRIPEADALPAFVFDKRKAYAKPETFVTVIYPYADVAPVVVVKERAGNDLIGGTRDLTIAIDAVERRGRASLQP